MKNRFLISLWAACGLLLALARPVLGQAPTFTEAISFNPSAANGISTGTATAINVAGDQYVTGFFTGTIAMGSTTLVSAGAADIFVAKRSGSTGAWLWAMRAGGSSVDEGTSVVVDGGGNALVTGSFQGTVTFATSPTINLSSTGSDDIFVAKFVAATGAAAWAVRAGGTGFERGQGVAVDAGGNALVTGYFEGMATFATSPAATGLTSAGSIDVFVAKFAATDGAATWAVRAGGTNFDIGHSIAVDGGGNALVTGFFYSTATFATSPVTNLFSAGNDDVFVAKFAAATGAVAWAVRAGGSGNDGSFGVAVDASGNALVTGSFVGTTTFATNPAVTSLTSIGGSDVFVAKFAAATGAVAWAVRAGGSGNDGSFDVAVDASGNALVTGYFQSTATFATSPAATSLISAGSTDVFVAKFAATDGAAAWAVRAGGAGDDFGQDVAVDTGGNALVTGDFESTVSFGSLTLIGGNGGFTGFIAKLQTAAPSSTTTGLNEALLTLTPNPARTAATLTLPAAAQARAVTVADALGRVVQSTTLPAQATALTLDVAGLAPGVYTVRCAAATARLLVE